MEMEARSGVRPRGQSQSAIGSETESGEAGHDRIRRRRKDFKEASDSDKLLIYEHENGKGRMEERGESNSIHLLLSLSFDAERNCGCP